MRRTRVRARIMKWPALAIRMKAEACRCNPRRNMSWSVMQTACTRLRIGYLRNWPVQGGGAKLEACCCCSGLQAVILQAGNAPGAIRR